MKKKIIMIFFIHLLVIEKEISHRRAINNDTYRNIIGYTFITTYRFTVSDSLNHF